MARYTSNRFKDIVICLPNYSQLKTVLQVVGRVGIGTNDAKTPLWIEGNTRIAGIITALTFKKEGGTSSQFLMADGSINNSTFLTSESDTLDAVLGRGNSTTKNLNVGIITATSIVGIASTAILATNAQGLTGTPSIVVDQITANNVSVAQTLTYEDVTSVDSVGMVTARMGIHVGPITAGVATVSTDGNANFTGIVTATSFSVTGAAAGTVLMADGTTNALNAEKLIDANNDTRVEANIHGAVVSGILTATSFSGSLTGNVTGNTSGSSGSCTGNSVTATDLSINATNRLLYQSANNSTDIMVAGNSGQVLQSNGDGDVPTWVNAAPASAISGLTLRQDGDQVGDANGVSQINFVGAAVTFTSTAGLGTVTIQTESVSSVIMSMIF